MFQALFWALSGTPFSYLPYNTPSRLKIKAFPFPRAFTPKELIFQIIWHYRPPPAQYYIPPDAPKHAPITNKPWKGVVVTLLVGSFSLLASLSIFLAAFKPFLASLTPFLTTKLFLSRRIFVHRHSPPHIIWYVFIKSYQGHPKKIRT